MFTLVAFWLFKSRTLLPCSIIWALMSAALLGAGFAWTGTAAGAAPGFQSFPVAALYSAFRTKRALTAASTWSCYKQKPIWIFAQIIYEINLYTLGALSPFNFLTLSPCSAIFPSISAPPVLGAEGAAEGSLMSGFQSRPVAALNFSFSSRSAFTSTPMAS